MLTRTKSQRGKIKKNTSIEADTAARSLKLNTKKSQVNVEDIIGKKSLVENAITIDLIGKVLNEIIIDQTSTVEVIEGTHQAVSVKQNINLQTRSKSVKFKVLVQT